MRRTPAAVVLAAALAAALGGAPSTASDAPGQAVASFGAALGPDEPPGDPFPIRRLRAAEADLPEILRQLDAGPVVRLPRGEFEARVRAAGRAAAEARVVPRVTDTRLAARLVGGDLVGTAEIDVVNPAASPRFLPLDPFRVAAGRAEWADGREAVVGVPPGAAGPAVWVDRAGARTLKFAWSLAGVEELGERRFEVRVPTASTAELALELPAGLVPSAAEALVTGPFPGAAGDSRAWRFRFGGRPRLDFVVRPAVQPGVTASAALEASYDIAPAQLAASFEYDLRPSKGTVGRWEFLVDPGLLVTDVVANDRAGWVVDPPEAPDGPRRLRVTLHQPGAGGKVRVAAVAPWPDPARPADAPLPGVRPAGASPDAETVRVRLAPGLRPENWNAGDYRLTAAQSLPDQGLQLTLTGTLLPAGADRPYRRLPAVRVGPAGPEFTTSEQVAWRFDAERAAATVRVGLRVTRGALFQFSLRAPAGYAFARARSAPDDLVAHASSAGGVATAEFARPLAAGQSADLTFEFRGPPLASARSLPFPAFVPPGATERVGVLAIDPGPLWAVEPAPGVGAYPAAWLDLSEPRVPPGASAAYRYRAASPEGAVNLAPRRPDFSAAVTTAVSPAPGGLSGKTSVALRVRSGALPSLLLVEAARGAAGRSWRVTGGGNAVASAVELPVQALGAAALRPGGWPARGAVAGAVGAAGVDPGPGRAWLVRFARPLTGEATLETTATRPLPPGAGPEAVAELSAAFGNWVVPAATPDAPAPAAPPGPGGPGPAGWAFAGLYLVTSVRSPADVVVVFGGTVESAAGPALPLRLPAGARVRAAAVSGKWLEPGAGRLSEEGVLNLPVPAGGPCRFEVRYRLSGEPGAAFGRVRSPEPGLPAGGHAVRRSWVFGPDVLPAWPAAGWRRASPDDLPNFLGDSPAAWTGGLAVSPSAADEVRIAPARLADALGLGAAALLLAGVLTGGPFGPWPRALGVVAGLVVVLGGAVLLGPPWWQRAAAAPLPAALVAAVVVGVSRARRAAVPLALALVAAVQLDTRAQPAGPAVVVILPADAAGREVVVAPKSVLDRLAAPPPAPGVVIASSDYAVTVDDGGARVAATFTAHALGDGEAVATLPLAEARLEKVTVNGAAAFPAAPRPGVYTVPLPGKGRHEIAVSFAVPAGGSGAEREVRFGVPECPATRLAAELPAAARQAQVVGRVGRRSSTEGGRVTLEADVGAARVLHLRWREGAGGAAAVKVREGCVWDLSEAGAELAACYLVRVEQGTVSSLAFEFPADLDLLAVTTRSLEPGGVAALRDWTLGAEKGPYRPLRVDFQAPAAGRLLVVLTASPRRPITRQPTLRFPRPLGAGPSSERDAAFGLRTSGLTVEDPGRSAVIDFAPDALTRDFAGVAELRLDPSAQVRVFRPTPAGTPQLRPTLRVAAELPSATLETTWHVGPKRADATGVVRWSGADAPEMAEIVLPGVRVLEVRGADVAGWSQAGNRVQVWFRRPARDGEFEWAGTAVVSSAPFAAATPRPADMRLAGETVRLRAAHGSALAVARDDGWTRAAPGALEFSAPEPAPSVLVRVSPAPRP